MLNWRVFIIISSYIIGIYYILSFFLFLFFTNNVFFWKKKPYVIRMSSPDVTCETKYLDWPRTAYHVCHHPNEKGWVLFFHSWGRRGDRMVPMGRVYWELGYSLVFIDARSFGMSQYVSASTAFGFAYDAIRIVEREQISYPIVHGLSFGSIAATIFSYHVPIKAAVYEALTSDLTCIYEDFFRALKIPYWLFFWMPKLIYLYDIPWEQGSPKHTLKRIMAPVFLIHGENDELFPPDPHYFTNKQVLVKHNPQAQYWLVPGSPHSKMHLHPDYPNRLREFLVHIDLEA